MCVNLNLKGSVVSEDLRFSTAMWTLPFSLGFLEAEEVSELCKDQFPVPLRIREDPKTVYSGNLKRCCLSSSLLAMFKVQETRR